MFTTLGITNIQSLSPQQLAYLAAFIDADGSIVARLVPQHEYVMGWVIRVSVNIHQSSLRRRILDEFQKQLGCGSCRTRGCGTMSDFSINSVEEVQQLSRSSLHEVAQRSIATYFVGVAIKDCYLHEVACTK